MELVKTKEGIQISGKVTIRTYRAGMVQKVLPILASIKTYRAMSLDPDKIGMKTYCQNRIDDLRKQIEVIKADHFIRVAAEMHNLVVDSPGYGIDLIIQRLVGINTYSLNINYIEIGTGTTAPTVNDTALTTPSVRAAVSYQEDFGATDAIVQAYITDANLPNNTYNEVGCFIDGTTTIGTGQMFNHALISPAYSKVSGEDTTIQIDFNITN